MMGTESESILASEGGPKAVPKLGPYPSKLGREELWELIDLWDLSPQNKERIKQILSEDPCVEGPHLLFFDGSAMLIPAFSTYLPEMDLTASDLQPSISHIWTLSTACLGSGMNR